MGAVIREQYWTELNRIGALKGGAECGLLKSSGRDEMRLHMNEMKVSFFCHFNFKALCFAYH